MNLAEVKFLPFNFAPMDWLPANGQSLHIDPYQSLFSILGTMYGGDGRHNFNVPDLRGRVAVHPGNDINEGTAGGSETIPVPSSPKTESNMQPFIGLNYIISLENAPGLEPMLGEVRLFAGNSHDLQGWSPCNGRLEQIKNHQTLYSLLLTSYGGDGRTTFALPDLRGRAPLGAGAAPGLSRYALGQTGGSEQITLPQSGSGSNIQPYSAFYPVIGNSGFITPGSSFPGYLGEIQLFAGNFAPQGWALCNGQQLRVSDNPSLFALIGNAYGGDGRTFFNLPNLRGRDAIGAGASGGPELTTRPIGESGGAPTIQAAAGAVVENVQPFTAINYMIAMQGGYPARP
ncbi:MAG: tail fiber protein [Chloroflexota bacterium]